MTLNHLNLSVRDVTEAKNFFETYFDFRVLEEKDRPPLTVMIDEGNFVLTVSRLTSEKPVYPKGFHVGFFQPDQAHVWKLYHKLQTGGFAPREPGPVHGSFGFYLEALGGVLIEVSCWE